MEGEREETDAYRGVEIIYQDHHTLIVNKPADMVIHPTYKNTDGRTMWDAILRYMQQSSGDDWLPPDLPDKPDWVGAPDDVRLMLRTKRTERLWKEDGLLARPCLLHRLDKDTSGVVALARTENARRYMVRQFHDQTITKRYLAVVQRGAYSWSLPRVPLTMMYQTVDGLKTVASVEDLFAGPMQVPYDLDGPLQRDPDDRRRCIVGPDGQEARTQIRILARDRRFALLDVRPVTGRTHQISRSSGGAGLCDRW